MNVTSKHIINSIAIISLVAMFFSCKTDFEEINDFLSDKNLPIAITKNIALVYTDSGYVGYKLKAPLLLNFENRKRQPYKEFPNGINITTFDKNGDSTKITANYARTFNKTKIAEIRGDVVVYNFSEKLTLKTSLMYWDQQENYFFSNKKSILTSPKNTIIGLEGFDSNADLSNATLMNNSGTLFITEK